MTIDDLEVGKCPFCSGEMVQTEAGYEYCEECGYIEVEV